MRPEVDSFSPLFCDPFSNVQLTDVLLNSTKQRFFATIIVALMNRNATYEA
jgi:hypothetical protein